MPHSVKLVRSVPIILAIILFLTAFSGNSQTAASQDACTQPLTAASVENDWTSDCLSIQREGSYALFYTFYLQEQSDVTIFLRSPVDTYLYLYSGLDTSAQYIDHNADITNTNLNSRIERTLQAGAYTIEATTSGRQRTGHFTLETTGIDHSYRPDLSDRAALTALYNATDGDNWEENDNWLTDAPLDEWEGVATDENRRVIELELDNNDLSGQIPRELARLSNLESLNLYTNQLTGTIPTELDNLTNLRDLDLGNNHLSGQIPKELGNLTYLTSLLLDENELVGAIPPKLGNLRELESLFLNDNQLTGQIPSELGNLINMEELWLNDNQFTGQIPSELGSLANLDTLLLGNNQLTGEIPPELGDLTELEELTLAGNNLTGCIPHTLRDVYDNDFHELALPFCESPDRAALTALYNATNGDNWHRNDNWLTDAPLDDWYGVDTNTEGRVIDLRLGKNELTGKIPNELSNLVELRILHLEFNSLSGNIPPTLGDLTHLQELRLAFNDLSGAIPPQVSSLSNLRALLLNDNRLSGQIPTSIGNLHALSYLDLGHNELTGDIPSGLSNLVSLKSLTFGSNEITGEVPSSFGNLSDLEILDMGNNRLTGKIPLSLTNLTNLRSFAFDHNAGLCAPADPAFQSWLQSIEYRGRICGAPPPGSDEAALIALYHATNGPNWHRHENWLTDAPLSEWYGVTTNEQGYVTRLDLSDNNLVGTIPYELGNLFETEAALWLWLGGNQLTGCIPETLRNVYASDLARIDLPFCNNPDRDVLVAIYNATDGDNWANNTNWLTDAPLYKWHGVNTDGRWSVHELTLNNNQLAGQLPPEIGEFHAVKAIEFANNQLTGTIPPELGNLHLAPVLIDLSDNQLTGTIPSELGNLDNLWGLELSNNQLTGTIPHELGELDDLEELYLAGNQLTGCIPDALREVEYNDYAELALPFCEDEPTPTPTPTPPLSPSQCSEHITNFRTYNRTLTNDCASNDRTEFGNHYARQFTFTLNHPTVVEVLLRSQFIDTHIFLFDDEGKTIVDIDDYIGRNAGFRKALQPGAYTVEVTTFRSDQTGDFSITFDRPELDALKALYESAGGAGWARKHNWLSDVPLSEWQGVQTDSEGRVTQVILIANNLTGEIPSALQDLTHLEGLYLGRNELSGSIPEELGNLTALQVLLLSDNNLTGRIPAQLGKLENLHELYLSRNQLSGPIPATLGRLDNLYNLHLAANELSDNIPAELGNLANLRHLSMSDNSLTGSIPPQLADLDNLTHLYLWGNELTSGSFFLRLGEMDSLQFLDIGGNRIAGAQMLPELEKLNNLTGLGLHDSGLTNSDLLDYMNDLKALDLEFLNLRSNDLSDPQILIGLSRITTLQRLAINDNKLSGQLPRSMTALTLMRIFYFNDNKGLCAPADAEFQNWLTGIRDFLGPNCAAAGPTAAPAPASHSTKASAPESSSPEDAISEAHSLSLLESIQPGR